MWVVYLALTSVANSVGCLVEKKVEKKVAKKVVNLAGLLAVEKVVLLVAA